MNKVEKYHQYVIDDLVKDTRIDYDKEKIYLPFRVSSTSFSSSSTSFSFFHLFLLPLPFYSYVEGKYGLKDDGVQNIWDQYKQRVQKILE
jgi:hypothetical protein